MQIVLHSKEERVEALEKEIQSKRADFRQAQEAQKKLDDTLAANKELET